MSEGPWGKERNIGTPQHDPRIERQMHVNRAISVITTKLGHRNECTDVEYDTSSRNTSGEHLTLSERGGDIRKILPIVEGYCDELNTEFRNLRAAIQVRAEFVPIDTRRGISTPAIVVFFD